MFNFSGSFFIWFTNSVWTDDVGYFITWVDIQKIADAGKSKLSEDIVKIINEKTAPLITKIDNLEKENIKLKNEVDAM
jgi:ethanolamine utilization protein EutP (predicted NTPase)